MERPDGCLRSRLGPELVGGVQVLRSPPCLGDLPVPQVKYPCVIEVVGANRSQTTDDFIKDAREVLKSR